MLLPNANARWVPLARLKSALARVDPGLWLALWPALFVIMPLLQPGLPGTADTPIHFYRTLELAHSLPSGSPFPRWAPDLAYGHGLPLWVFVPPLPYLIPLALHATGLSLEVSLKGLIILSVLAYALGAYLFVRAMWGSPAGLLAAAVYTLAPFALREALLYGGNYPQYLAIALFPWLLWAIGRSMRSARWCDVWLTALIYGAIILSHLFHALAVTPVAVLFAGALSLTHPRRGRALLASAAGLLLGLGWTAFFWLPALIERHFTRAVESIYVEVSPFYLRFLSWDELLALPQALDARAANPWAPFSLAPVTLTLALIGLVALARHWRTTALWLPGAFCLVLLGGSLFLMLPLSQPVWQAIPLLAVAEFPWRLLGLANLGLAGLAGASALVWDGPARALRFSVWRGAGRLWPLIGGLAVLLGAMVYLYPFRPFVHYGASLADMARFELTTRTVGTTTLGEYLPRWVKSIPKQPPLAEALGRGHAIEWLDRDGLPPGTRAQRLVDTPTNLSYALDVPQAGSARFLIYYFPGWQAYLDGQPVDIQIEPQTGFISLALPAGEHRLQLSFGETPLRFGASLITGLSLAGMAGFWLWWAARRPRVHQGEVVAPSPHRQAAGADRTPLPVALMAASVLGLLTIKGLLIDPHTDWFRRRSPPDQVIGVQHPLRANLEGRFWLLGYDVSAAQVPQGGTLRLTLYWQAQAATPINYRSFVHLDAPGDQRTWAASDHVHPGDATAQIDLPTSSWDTSHYVRDVHLLSLPPDLPPARFNLRAGLYDPASGRRLAIMDSQTDTLALQTIQVTPGPGVPAGGIAHPLDYRLGGFMRLLGYDWQAADRTLTLYWRAEQQPPADLVVFVHILDGQGRLVWGADSPPAGGLYPSIAWQAGISFADLRQLALDGLPPGTYTLAVGMYQAADLARLPVLDGQGAPVTDDSIRLMTLSLP